MTPVALLQWHLSWLHSLSIKNQISPFSILSSATECLAQNRHASHMVSALLIRLLRVDGTWLTQKLRILIPIKTGTAAKLLSWQQHHRVILFLSWCTFLEENCSNMCRDILDSVFYHFSCTVYYLITYPNLHNTKTLISLERKKIFQKRKHHSSEFGEAFQIRSTYFSFHGHFKRYECSNNTLSLFGSIP